MHFFKGWVGIWGSNECIPPNTVVLDYRLREFAGEAKDLTQPASPDPVNGSRSGTRQPKLFIINYKLQKLL